MMIGILLFIIGLSVGSFINALVYRLQTKQSIFWGRSMCPKCKKSIRWYDLQPLISFLILKGHCRFCRTRISWQYPFIELVTGLVFIAPFFRYQFISSSFVIYLIFSVILMVIFAYDLRYMLIPDRISLPAIILVAVIQLVFYQFQLIEISKLFMAGLIALVFFLLQFVVSKGRWIGGGDLRLGVLMGLMVGWPNIIVALFIAYVLGSVVCVPLVLVSKTNMKSQVPFGVFLTISTIIVLLWGEPLVNWYLGLVIG